LNELEDNVLGSLCTSQILEPLKNQEPNIQEDEFSIKRSLKYPGNSIGKIHESQENPHCVSTKEPSSCHDAPLHSSPSPSTDYKTQEKEEVPKEGGDCIEAF